MISGSCRLRGGGGGVGNLLSLGNVQCSQSARAASPFGITGHFGPSIGSVRYFGAGDEKVVKARMRSVRSIQKITKAMKMVAASKLKHDQRRLENGMPFCQPFIRLMSRLTMNDSSSSTDPSATASSSSSSSSSSVGKNKDCLLVAFSSDKGLCGGINSSVAKLARTTIAEKEAHGATVRFLGIGDKVRAALQRNYADRFERILSEIGQPVNFAMASIITQRILALKGGSVVFLHNHFKSLISYDTTSTPVLSSEEAKSVNMKPLAQYEFEPEAAEMWEDFHTFYMAASVYGALLDGIASEQSARMSAMDNASKNAGEMLDKLTLAYNKARQMKITMELIEIISGANAL